MKILKIFGIVVGIHVFALVLIFANPGCSSSSKPPAATETVAKAEPAPAPITVPNTGPAQTPITFNPDAPAMAAPSSNDRRFTPTRPNTPAATALVAEPVKDVTPMTTYTVSSNDSLWSIAKKNNLTYQELAAANNIKSNAVLKPGQKLIIPGKTPQVTPAPSAAAPATKSATVTPAAAKPAANGMRHTVVSGETLGTIAQRYGVKQRDLAIANNITDPLKLAAGKELVIPGWDPATPKPAGKSSTKSSSAPASNPSTDPALFAPPASGQVPVISAQPATSAEVPVIRVEETKKP